MVVVILVNLSTLGESFLFGEFRWTSLLWFFGFVWLSMVDLVIWLLVVFTLWAGWFSVLSVMMRWVCLRKSGFCCILLIWGLVSWV